MRLWTEENPYILVLNCFEKKQKAVIKEEIMLEKKICFRFPKGYHNKIIFSLIIYINHDHG